MPIFCFHTLANRETYGRGFFEYPDSLGKGPGTAVTSVTRFHYSAPDTGELNEVQNIHFVIGVHENVSQLNLVAASPDRLRSLVAGPAQPHRLGPVSGGAGLQLEWPREVSSTDECLGAPQPAVQPAEPLPTPQPTPAPSPQPEPQPAPHLEPQPAPQPEPAPMPMMARVVITTIFYDGVTKFTEADEYIEIGNQGNAPADISGWRVYADDRSQDFSFAAGTVLQPGQIVRIYTNEIHPESGGLSFGSRRAIWNNKGDTGYLYDASGQVVSSFRYP